MIFWTCLVETSVVDAHPKLPTYLGDDNRVGQPPWVVDLPDEARVKQLFNLFSDKVLPLYGLLLGLLLDWSGVRVDLQMVLNHLPGDPRHLQRLLGKHAYISLEEGDEREFLFTVQIPHDVGDLGSICPDLNGLHRDVLFAKGLHTGANNEPRLCELEGA
jgi:hypothetical protein